MTPPYRSPAHLLSVYSPQVVRRQRVYDDSGSCDDTGDAMAATMQWQRVIDGTEAATPPWPRGPKAAFRWGPHMRLHRGRSCH